MSGFITSAILLETAFFKRCAFKHFLEDCMRARECDHYGNLNTQNNETYYSQINIKSNLKDSFCKKNVWLVCLAAYQLVRCSKSFKNICERVQFYTAELPFQRIQNHFLWIKLLKTNVIVANNDLLKDSKTVIWITLFAFFRSSRTECSEIMQQICRRTPMSKCHLNNVPLQLYWNCTSEWMFSCKFAAYFQNTFSQEHLCMAASVFYFCIFILPLKKNF